MLERAFHLTDNLLDSGQYFSLRMLLKNAKADPKGVRQLLADLLNEDRDLIERIASFQAGFRELNKKSFPGKEDYQDHRAILVYLYLRYPNRYYLYKYTMFEEFVRLVDYPFQPSIG